MWVIFLKKIFNNFSSKVTEKNWIYEGKNMILKKNCNNKNYLGSVVNLKMRNFLKNFVFINLRKNIKKFTELSTIVKTAFT